MPAVDVTSNFAFSACAFSAIYAVGWVAGRASGLQKTEWYLGCRHGYLSGTRCRFAYGPADATVTHCLLLQEIQICFGFGFTFQVPAHPGSPGQNPESRKTVVVVMGKTGERAMSFFCVISCLFSVMPYALVVVDYSRRKKCRRSTQSLSKT